jgi:hypothetical protein
LFWVKGQPNLRIFVLPGSGFGGEMVEPTYSSIAQSRGKVCDRRRHGLPISPMKAN